MDAIVEYKEKHSRATEKLQKVSKRPIEVFGLIQACTVVAQTLGVTPQTVINYILGKGKDGYLIDAMTDEFKKM